MRSRKLYKICIGDILGLLQPMRIYQCSALLFRKSLMLLNIEISR